MGCLTFFKSCFELEVLNSIFLSTGCVSLGVIDTRKAFMYLSLFLLMLSNQHNDCGGRDMYLFTSKDLQVRALLLQTCMKAALFKFVSLLGLMQVHTSLNLHFWAQPQSEWPWFCHVLYSSKCSISQECEGFFQSFPSLYTCIATVCMVKAQGPTWEIYWFPELRLQELPMPTSPFHLCIWGNQTWGHRGSNTELCNTVCV